jgi:hypothetical protein
MGLANTTYSEDKAMNGQTRARLAALVGTVALLLTGISACDVDTTTKQGVEQAIEIAETPNITMTDWSRDELGKAFHYDARQAKLHTQELVAADLAKTITRQTAVIVAKAEAPNPDRG